MPPWVHLIVQYCNHRLPARQAEYDYCFRRNLNNPWVKRIHNLVDGQTVVPEEFRRHPKYIQGSRVGRFLTFREAFDYCNRNLAGEDVCILNLDIFLDDAGTDWEKARQMTQSGLVLALARTEFDEAGGMYRDPAYANSGFAHSQDAWIFQAPFEVADCDFGIGTSGCDNAIAERIKRAGRVPVNAASRFKILHFDRARGKTIANQKQMHAQERQGLPQQYPEEQGQLLLPDIDLVHSVDLVLQAFNATELQRYRIICDAMTSLKQVSNR